jgi:hypothetical protein
MTVRIGQNHRARGPANAARRRCSRRRATVIAILVVCTLSACTGSGSARPSTPATLRIVTPAPDAHTGRDVDVRVVLDHARIVSAPTGTQLNPKEGHVHVSLDGQFIAMSYDLNRQLTALAPGRHTVQAEFVATDHLPFGNRVVAAVTFTVD